MSSLLPTLYIHSLEADRLGDGLSSGSSSGLSASVLRSLSSRAIYLSMRGDAVVLDAMPDPSWLKYLSGIGIQTGDVHVPAGHGDTVIQRLLSDSELLTTLGKRSWNISPYMGGDEVQQLATLLDCHVQSPPTPLLDRLNLKSNLLPILIELDLPTIPTTTSTRNDLIAETRAIHAQTGAVMVRSDLSIGGLGVWKVEQEGDIETLDIESQKSNPDRLFILQPLLEVRNSPNVQFDITSDGCRFLGVSEQQMTQSFAFGGNEYPSAYANDRQIMNQGDRIAHWLHDQGYRGLVGIDFIVTTENKVFVVEINPRVNTSTFPLLMCDRLGCSAFRLVTGIPAGGHAGFERIAEFLGGGLLYDSDRGNGVVPLMIPTSDRPVLDAMIFADDLETVRAIADELDERSKKRTPSVGVPT
ncbi:MAG: ATP-grasp domain-containing protein [Phycisphaerales bacterium]